MTSDRDNRWSWVDHAKGIGIILVVYGHVARGLFEAGIPMHKVSFELIDKIIYSFHMPLFFFAAGLFVFHSLNKRGPLSFLLNKCEVILYPYILWSLLQGGIEVFGSRYTNGHIAMGEVLTLWLPRAQFWFLYSLMFMFIFSSILFRFVSREKYFVGSMLLAGVLVLLCLPLGEQWGVGYVRHLIYFSAGCAAAWKGRDILSHVDPRLFWAIALLFVCAEFLLCSLSGISYYGTTAIRLFAGGAGILFCLSLFSLSSGAVRNILIRLGKASMFIYLAHVIIGGGIRIFLNHCLHLDNYFLHLVLGVTAGLLIPFVIFEVYGHTPWVQGLIKFPRSTHEHV